MRKNDCLYFDLLDETQEGYIIRKLQGYLQKYIFFEFLSMH